MIDVYVKEFVAVVSHLKGLEKAQERGGYLIVEKTALIELLNRNAYETAANKLKVWRGLRWIDTDQKRFTARVYNSGVPVPAIKISESVFNTLVRIANNR